MADRQWFMSSPAVLDYMGVHRRRLVEGGPDFEAAAAELDAISRAARRVRVLESGCEIWRASVALDWARATGLFDLHVMPPHDQYPLPQLVRVRLKRGPR